MLDEFIAFPKIDRYTNETFVITEKIDGTNACLAFFEEPDGFSMATQSRKRIITPDDDNYGFATWAYENVQELYSILGPGRHYGEWWGQGIQRNYGQKTKRFSLFNVHRWSELYEEIGGIPVNSVPVICNGELSGLSHAVAYAHATLRTLGSLAAPFVNPEGAVIYLHRLNKYLKAPLDETPKWAQVSSGTQQRPSAEVRLAAAQEMVAA